ncbi:MAG: hypothetical protein JXR83_10335 [Deltaproteobacteria bacterium]|nr:hypothetical protein [Deltaproteobacteria bacterium]
MHRTWPAWGLLWLLGIGGCPGQTAATPPGDPDAAHDAGQSGDRDAGQSGDRDAGQSGDRDAGQSGDRDAGRDAAADTGVDSGTDSGADAGPEAGPPFAPTAATSLAADGRLALSSNVPARTDGCPESLGEVCADADGDDLVDAWEEMALELLRPRLRLDEGEDLLGDPAAVVAAIGHIYPTSLAPLEVRALIVIGYSRDYGSCLGISAHNGDTERVALRLVALTAPGDVVVSAAFTAAHDGAPLDHNRLLAGDELQEMEFVDGESGPRWLVYASEDKHASYVSVADCEFSDIPCFDEDCSPDGVADPSAFELLPPVVNAGEPAAPLVEDLAALGFAGEDAWLDQPFCGGRTRGGICAGSVRKKLTTDPFAEP